MRKCTCCGVVKRVEEFRDDREGLTTCKACNRATARAWQDRLQRTKNLVGLTRSQIRGLPQEKRLHMMAWADDYIDTATSSKRWALVKSNKLSDNPIICETGGMIGVHKEKVRELQRITTELVSIWNERDAAR